MLRSNEEFIAMNEKRRAFHVGRNSSCRQHIRQHWALYEKKCKEKNILVNHHVIPREVLRNMEAAKSESSKEMKKQSTLKFKKVTGPCEFTREGVLQAVAKLMATNDQVNLNLL